MQQATSLELSRKKAAFFKAQLELTEKYLGDLDEADKLDQGRLNKPFALDLDPNHLPDVERLKERIQFHEHAIVLMQANNQTRILYTDPEARVMPAKQSGKRGVKSPRFLLLYASKAKISKM